MSRRTIRCCNILAVVCKETLGVEVVLSVLLIPRYVVLSFYVVCWRNGYKVDRFNSSRTWSVHGEMYVYFCGIMVYNTDYFVCESFGPTY